MHTKVLFTVLLSIATIWSVSAQKLTGNLAPLKGQKEVNFVLDFSGTLVNGKAEAQYIEDETKGKTAEEKAKWLVEWNEKLRADAYAKVTSFFNKRMSETFFSVGEFAKAEYTITVKVKDITTGYYRGVSARPSMIKSDVSFVKKGETTPFATVEYKNSCSRMSSTVPYFVTRIVMSFGAIGDDLAATVTNALK